MRTPIRFETVTRQEQFDELKRLDKEDGHNILSDTSLTPIVTIRRGETPLGYFHVLNQPVVMPVFNMKNCSPRDFQEICDKVAAIYQFTSMSERFPNGTIFIALPKNPVTGTEVIEKLGYKNINRELWQFTPGGTK